LPNPKWSIFGEFQTFKNKIYSDDLFKFGIANLISKNSQVDLNFGGSFKTTPSYTYINVGFSQRFDWHQDISEEQKQAKKILMISSSKEKNNKRLVKKSSKKTNSKKLVKRENRKSKKTVNRSLKQNKKQLKKDQKALKKINRKK
jgi:hypothetical protein